MSNWVLRAEDGTHQVVTEGESCDIVITLGDTGGEAIDAGNMTSVVGALMLADGTVINSRSGVNFLNANGGTLSASVLTVKLVPDDNPIVDSSLTTGDTETHLFQVTYVYDDTAAVERQGIETFEFNVEKRARPTS